MIQEQASAQAEESAPVVMNLATRVVSEQLGAKPEELRRLLGDLTRLPHVQYCRLELPDQPTPAAALEVRAARATPAAARPLRAELRDAEGRLLGVLVVGYGAGPSAAVTGILWTASGLVAIGSLAAFWVIYRRMHRRLRPISFVRENLLAYHSGAERALELLLVHESAGSEATAWNALLSVVSQMQRELDGYRCRQTVAESLLNLHSHCAERILSALPIGVLRIDPEDRVVYSNYSARRLLQMRDSQEERPRLSDEVRQPAVLQAIVGLRQNTAGTGVDCRLEYAGGYSIVHLTSIGLGSESDDLVVTIQDITQLKEVEHSRDQFLAHITHELRTPLTNIRAYAETLSDDFFDDEKTRRECYNVIMTETRRLSKLIEDVLSVSQIEAGAARLTRVTMRLDESLRQAAQEVQAAADAKSIELSLKIPSKVPPISGDRHRLHQVWMNLIGNAIKYTPKGGSVSITVEPDDRLVRVRVTDTGIGIAPEFHEKIFEKFFRVDDSAVEAEQGTGLGLAIAREIVRLHNGSIWVESQKGAGATFVVELPTVQTAESGEQVGSTDGVHRDR